MPTAFALAAIVLLAGDRPWVIAVPARDAARQQVEAAGKDPALRLEAARFCGRAGQFSEMLKAAAGADAAARAELLGMTTVDGKPAFEELARFSEAPPQRAHLPALDARTRAALLKDRFHDMQKAADTTYFNFYSDLTGDDLQVYMTALNGWFRELKNRFRAYTTTNIDVNLFAQRSNYMFFHAVVMGTSGEHVNGFYLPGLRLLTFFDDPLDRVAILNTARHECTHLLIDLSYKGAPMPRWLHEGLACFLAADATAAEGRYTMQLVIELQRQLAARKSMPMSELLDLAHAKFEYPHYAWAWSVFQFLNAGKHQPEAQKFLLALRDALPAPEKEGEPITPDQMRQVTHDVFAKTFGGDLELLELEWREYFRDQFALERPAQSLDYAAAAIERVPGVPVKDKAERERLLEIARPALERASAEPALAGEAALLEARRLLFCAQVAEAGLDEVRLALRAARDLIKTAPAPADDSLRASVVRTALYLVGSIKGVDRELGSGAFDMHAALVAAAKRAEGDRQALLKAICVDCDELVAIAVDSQAKLLAQHPAHANAAVQLLLLAMEADPTLLPEIFPTLQLLAEISPDDRNQALLGIAYFGMGKQRFGKLLVEEGTWLSAQPSLMAELRSYVGLR